MCMHHIIEKSSVLETLSKGVTHEVHRSQKVFFAPITPASPYWCLLLIGNWRLCWDDVRRFGCSFRSLCRKRPIHLPPTKLARLLNNIYIAKEYKLSKRLPKSAPSSKSHGVSLFSRARSGVQCVFVFCEYASTQCRCSPARKPSSKYLATQSPAHIKVNTFVNTCIATGLQTYGRNAPVMPA